MLARLPFLKLMAFARGCSEAAIRDIGQLSDFDAAAGHQR
jgi:hypothetical protein